jgi:hypothetical protein
MLSLLIAAVLAQSAPPLKAEAELSPQAKSPALKLDPNYRPKVGDRALLVSFTLADAKEPILPVLYPDFGAARRAYEGYADASGIRLPVATPVQIDRMTGIDLMRAGKRLRVVLAVLHILGGGEGADVSYYCDERFLGRPLGSSELLYPPDSPSQSPEKTERAYAPPPVRRYRSQEAQRQLNMQLLGQMTQQALENGAADQEYLYRSMTPGSPRARGQSHYCGAPTLKGGPCQRLVIGPGYCWQHQGY